MDPIAQFPPQADVTAALNASFAAAVAAEAGAPASQTPAPVAAPVALQAAPVVPQPPAPQDPTLAQSPSLQPTPAEAAPTPEQQQQAAAATLNDQALYSVPQSDGTTTMMSGKELRESILRQSDYTKKTQVLAKQRQEVEAVLPTLQQLQQRQAALDADLANPRAVAEYVARQGWGPQFSQFFGPQGAPQGQPPAAPVDPNDVASQGFVQEQTRTVQQQIADLQAQFAYQVQQIQAQNQQAIATAQQAAQEEAVNRIQIAQHKQTVDAGLPAIFNEFPLIQGVPHVTEMLKFEVLKNYEPRNPQEALQCFQLEAKKLDASIRQSFTAQQKSQLITQQQPQLQPLATSGGGSPLTAQQTGPRTFITPDGQGDWKALSAGVLDLFKNAQ